MAGAIHDTLHGPIGDRRDVFVNARFDEQLHLGRCTGAVRARRMAARRRGADVGSGFAEVERMVIRIGGSNGATGVAGAGNLSQLDQNRLMDLVRNTQTQNPSVLAQQLGLNLDGFSRGNAAPINQEIANLARNRGVYTDGPAIDGGLQMGHKGEGVRELQKLLNQFGAGLAEDGKLGPKTEAALKAFQESRGLPATGMLDAGSLQGLRAGGAPISPELLRKNSPGLGGDSDLARRLDATHAANPPRSMPGDMSPDQLQRIVGNGMSAERAAELAPHLNAAMREANITTDRAKAAFVSQLAHESGGFRHMEELASGRAYEGRRDLGNTQPGDGERYKGRGPIQLTGRANYEAAGRALGLDLVNNPDVVSRPDVGFRVAAWYWNSRNINPMADQGNFVGVTRAINGGTNGLDDRMRYYERALNVLA